MTKLEIIKKLATLINTDPEYKSIINTIEQHNPQSEHFGIIWLKNLFEDYNGAGPILSVKYTIDINKAMVKKLLFYMASVSIISNALTKLLPAASPRVLDINGTAVEINKITCNGMINEANESRSNITTSYTIEASYGQYGQTDLIFTDAKLLIHVGSLTETAATTYINYNPAVFIGLHMPHIPTNGLRARTAEDLATLDKQLAEKVFFDLLEDCLQRYRF